MPRVAKSAPLPYAVGDTIAVFALPDRSFRTAGQVTAIFNSGLLLTSSDNHTSTWVGFGHAFEIEVAISNPPDAG